MGRPRKHPIVTIKTLAKEAVERQKLRKKEVKLRPLRIFEVFITHENYSITSHLFDESGVEYVKRGGEK